MRQRGGVVLGLTPGFRSFGWALMRIEPEMELVLCAGVLRTRTAWRTSDDISSQDMHRRGRELAALLRLVVQRERVDVIAARALEWLRSAKTMQESGRAWGVVDTYAAAADIPLLEVAPQDLSLAMTHRRDASREDVEHAVRVRYPGEWIAALEDEVTEGQREHAFEAVAVAAAALPSQVCRATRQMVRAA